MAGRGWRCSVGSAAVAVLLLSTAPVAPAQAEPQAGSTDVVEQVIAGYRARIPELIAREHVPGLSLAVVDAGGVVWQEAFGSTDTDGRTPVTVDTIFSVQSMSKTFTATAVMQAVQSGGLDLDVPITRYLPEFTVHSAFESRPQERITLRMLLGHTAGFTHEAPLGNNYEREAPDFDTHVRSISDTWLRFPVGTGYAYSNLGIDLAGYVLQRTAGQPFATVMEDSVLAPLGMHHSTFDRGRVHRDARRAVGHDGGPVPPPADVPMSGAGGLWSSAADLARFLQFQLGDGTVDGRTVLDAALMEEMRTVPAPDAGAPAGYALGVARTRWAAGRNLDLFTHGGGGYGFLSDLWWLPQLGLGVAVLTNSSDHDLQGSLALGILHDLVSTPGSVYHDRMLALPAQEAVAEPDGRFVAPPGLAGRIAATAMPASTAQRERWAGYTGLYRTGALGEMSPMLPPSRFHVESGVPCFDAAEDGTPVAHGLTEFQPGLFLAENGEVLDLRAAAPRWRGLDLHRVDGGPVGWQWALLVAVALIATGWLLLSGALAVRHLLRRLRRPTDSTVAREGRGGRGGRRAATCVALLGAVAALATVLAIRVLPALVDVGFLGRMEWDLPIRWALHLPLGVAVLGACLVGLLLVGARRRWWARTVPVLDAVLAVGLVALTAQLASWQLVAWGF